CACASGRAWWRWRRCTWPWASTRTGSQATCLRHEPSSCPPTPSARSSCASWTCWTFTSAKLMPKSSNSSGHI
ncbi:hypothetical protein IWW55_005362, partial [Coemansia sp. RSA 2706]